MQNETDRIPSAQNSIWIWIMLAIVLVLGALIAVGLLALTHVNEQSQTPTGSQTVPSSR